MFARLRPHLPAALLAAILTAAWAARGWGELSALRLPDTDDAMRLQQVRDWIAGQGLRDLHQYRLGQGVAMHWSRIGDLVPAAIIVGLRWLIGQPAAELVAVIAWPFAVFAALLGLLGSIARRLAPGAAGPAMVLGALAYPATTLVMPGRIDHHALQVVLVLVQLRALLAVPGWRSGAVAGAAVAVGAAIGLETLPFACLTGAVVALGWLCGDGGERQLGFGAALALGLAALLPLAGQGVGCDTVQPLAPPAMIAAALMAALALRPPRMLTLGVAGGAVAALAWAPAGTCLAGPYAGVDPLVARLWLANVGEAQPLFGAPMSQAVGYAGLMLAGLAAAVWLAWRRRGGWGTVLAYQVASLAITLDQLRGAYVGAALAAVPIAALIVAARNRKRMVAVLGLWAAGAGSLYPMIAAALTPAGIDGGLAESCTSPAALARLAALPAGRVMAPIDLGAYAIAATRHTLIAGPYHRNDAGNAATYRFFLGDDATAHAIARRWRVDYVALCPGAFAETAPLRPATIAGGARPDWLRPIGGQGVPALFAVAR